ncbi:hypothetical protein IV203_031817 [Nitzschia inconspicua]|uniref:Transmembrane protein n=1 Tax=Nitzschia inconspicua TaxID=303405 RepID=A0A9K3Q5F3_9STRA|nr:hypothetical protein IV203_031817 [Nitzschia inconspicua]
MPSSSDNDNPWESASNDHAFRSRHDAKHPSGEAPRESPPRSARLNWHEEDVEEGTGAGAGGNNNGGRFSMDIHQRDQDQTSSGGGRRNDHCQNFCTLFSMHNVLHTLDAVVTLLLVVFVGYTLHYQDNGGDDHHESPEQIAILMISTVIAILVVWRALLMSCLCPSKRCSKSCSTHLTLLLTGSYTILALISWIVLNKNTSAVPWCWSLGKWCTATPKAVPISLTFLALVEVLRFVFSQGQLAQFDSDHPQTLPPTGSRHHGEEESFYASRRHRPWWWNHRSGGGNRGDDTAMHESLLGNNGQPGWTASGGQSYLMDDGVGTPTSRRFLGGWFGFRGGNDNSNPRDDGSVDYASLNEEWASRSEEDPYWWTREESNNNHSDPM